MPTAACEESLRNHILSVSPVHEKSINKLTEAFTPINLPANAFLSMSGEYPSVFGFLCEGIIVSYYTDQQNKKHVMDIFKLHEFVLPMPSYIYRQPAFLNFQALFASRLLQAKYAVVDSLAQQHSSIKLFLRALIDREWIIRKSFNESAAFVYNAHTRFRLVQDRLGEDLNRIPVPVLASFLRIPEKQLSRYL